MSTHTINSNDDQVNLQQSVHAFLETIMRMAIVHSDGTVVSEFPVCAYNDVQIALHQARCPDQPLPRWLENTRHQEEIKRIRLSHER